MTDDGTTVLEGYCVKCKEKVTFAGIIEVDNGRQFGKGYCPKCDTKVVRILGKVEKPMMKAEVGRSGGPADGWEGLPDNWTPAKGLDAVTHALRLSIDEAYGPPVTDTQKYIAEVGLALTHLLLLKNQRYGDSALNPVEVFAKGLTKRQRMAVRMDDKVNRLVNNGAKTDDGERADVDLAGYILLDIIAEWLENNG